MMAMHATSSNPALIALPNDSARTDARLTELEIKVSYTEDTLDQLDQTIIRQQAQIDLLLRELTLLRQQQSSDGGSPRNPHDELPPHY